MIPIFGKNRTVASTFKPQVGGTLIFSHIRRLGLFFGFKILNFNIFLGYEDFVDIFCGHHKIGLV